MVWALRSRPTPTRPETSTGVIHEHNRSLPQMWWQRIQRPPDRASMFFVWRSEADSVRKVGILAAGAATGGTAATPAADVTGPGGVGRKLAAYPGKPHRQRKKTATYETGFWLLKTSFLVLPMTGEPCPQCHQGHVVVYKSRRSACGQWQTQYLACWLCHAKPTPCKRVVPARPIQNRCTRLVQTSSVILSTPTNERGE